MSTVTALVATVVVTCSSCQDDDGPGCTLMGAVSSAQVEVSRELARQAEGPSGNERAASLTVEACSEDVCHDVGIPRGDTVQDSNFVYVDGVDPATDERLVVSLVGAQDRVLASTETPIEFETEYPNGPGCEGQVVMKEQVVRLS